MQLELRVKVDLKRKKENKTAKALVVLVAVTAGLRNFIEAGGHVFANSKKNGHRTISLGARWLASTVVDRYQSYFLICPVDEWGCGAIDTAPAAQTINSTHQERVRHLYSWEGLVIIPLPVPCHLGMISSAGRAFTTPLVFLFIAQTRGLWVKAGRVCRCSPLQDGLKDLSFLPAPPLLK